MSIQVVYGEKLKSSGTNYADHVSQLVPTVQRLGHLETKAQTAFLKRMKLYWKFYRTTTYSYPSINYKVNRIKILDNILRFDNAWGVCSRTGAKTNPEHSKFQHNTEFFFDWSCKLIGTTRICARVQRLSHLESKVQLAFLE